MDVRVLKRGNILYLAITTMDEGSKSICAPLQPMRTSCECCCNDFRPSSSKPRPNQTCGTAGGKRPLGLRHGGVRGTGVGARWSETVRGVTEGPQLRFDPFAKDLERGDAAAAAATVAVVATQERQAGAVVVITLAVCATCLLVRHSSSVCSGGVAAGVVPSPGSGSGPGPGPGPGPFAVTCGCGHEPTLLLSSSPLSSSGVQTHSNYRYCVSIFYAFRVAVIF